MQTTNLTSHFIIAMPNLMDANFNQTVTYICEHNEDGAFGVVINRKSDITFDDIIFHMDIAPARRAALLKPSITAGRCSRSVVSSFTSPSANGPRA